MAVKANQGQLSVGQGAKALSGKGWGECGAVGQGVKVLSPDIFALP